MEPVAGPAGEPGLDQRVQLVAVAVLEDDHRFPPEVFDGKDRGGAVVDLVRCADLLQPALVHDRDPVPHGHRRHPRCRDLSDRFMVGGLRTWRSCNWGETHTSAGAVDG